jgi:predicted Zn-dependent protease
MDKYLKYISQEQQELFERYLMGEMPVAEQLSLNSRLVDDDDLRKSLEEFRALFETVEEDGLRSKLEDIHQSIELEKDTTVRKLNTSKFQFNYRIAASIAILLVIGGFWFFNRQNPNEKLFNDYYSPDPGLPTVMGSNDNYDFYEAMVDYKQGKYDVAIEKWKKLLSSKPENDTLNYFLGSAYLAIGNEKQSIHHLRLTSKVKSSIFANEVYLFLGMAYLKNSELELAKQNLNLSDEDKAKELLKALDKE